MPLYKTHNRFTLPIINYCNRCMKHVSWVSCTYHTLLILQYNKSIFWRWFARRWRTHFHCVIKLPSTIHASVIVKTLRTVPLEGQNHCIIGGRLSSLRGKSGEMRGIALGRGGHIWPQPDARIQNMCILTYVWIFFSKPLFFLLHFRHEKIWIAETVWLKIDRSGCGNEFPRRNRKSDKNWKTICVVFTKCPSNIEIYFNPEQAKLQQ